MQKTEIFAYNLNKWVIKNGAKCGALCEGITDIDQFNNISIIGLF